MCEVFTTGLTSARLDIAVKLGVAAKRIGVPLAAGVADSSFAMWNHSGNWHRKRLRPRRKPEPGPPGVGSRCTTIERPRCSQQ
jgi:hypothetical protein